MSGNSKGGDGIFLLMFLMAIVWGSSWLVWNSFRPQLTGAVLALRNAEMSVVSLWMPDDHVLKIPVVKTVNDDKPLNPRLGEPEKTSELDARFGDWKNFVRNADVSAVHNQHLQVMTYVALDTLRYPIAGAIFLVFLWIVINGPTSRFHRVMGLEKLIHDQSRMFPVIRPFLKFNPNTLPIRVPGSAVPVDLPMFSEALAPEEWMARNEVPVDANNLPDRARAEAAFARQLGPVWKGWHSLPKELQILLACFCLKASRKRNESDDMLGRLMTCWDHKSGLVLSRDRGLYGEARKILKDKKLSEKTLENCNRHAYISTALMRALSTAREEGGVLAPSMFLWLRAHNRALWYPLNNLGRQAFHAEALGVAAHYRAEKQINRPIPKPRVMEAVDGLVEFQKNTILARPLPPVDYGPNGKKPKPGAKAA